MPPATLCDELITLLENQRYSGDGRVWLSPDNLAWLTREVTPKPRETHTLPPMTADPSPATAPSPAAPSQPQATPQAPAIPSFPPSGQTAAPRAAETAPPPPPAPISLAPLADLSGDLDALRNIVAGCQRCGLCADRTQPVFGSGNPSAKIMFIGEGPGTDEDQAGIPFVGPAGDLFTKILTAGMGITRDDVYMTLVVKCNLPKNRKPADNEAEACLPYLKRQIELVAPEVIVTLGAVPLHRLLGVKGITKARGQWLAYEGIPVMPTLHPSYLLRVPTAKREVWQDIQQVMAHMGLSRPES